MNAPASKVVTLEQLRDIIQSLKSKGKKVVQAHGVFDLLHVGHLRHLQQARSHGDVLVVTITPDEHVNKGPFRPAFSQPFRMEMLSSLDLIDYVAANRWPSAVEAIRFLQPDVYVKGPDYQDSKADLSGGITKEEEAVRSVGGDPLTEGVTFSSSNLINEHLDLLPDEIKAFLKTIRERFKSGDLIQALDRLKGLKVLVIGEIILDEYVYCAAMGKSSKEPILAMLRQESEMFAGGVLAIANHLADFCAGVQVIGYLGEGNDRAEFVQGHLRPGVQLIPIEKKASPTIVKRRYVESYLLTKLFEVYTMNDAPLSAGEEARFCDILRERLPHADVVILADYGHGLMTRPAIELIAEKSRFLAVNTQINAANVGFHTISKYPRADYICIHDGELRLEFRNRTDDLRPMVEELSRKLRCPAIMVTRGKRGTLYYSAKSGFTEAPAFAMKVVDRIGAGDAVLALSSLCAATGVPPAAIGLIGNLIGAQAVTIVGNRTPVERLKLLKSLESLLK